MLIIFLMMYICEKFEFDSQISRNLGQIKDFITLKSAHCSKTKNKNKPYTIDKHARDK